MNEQDWLTFTEPGPVMQSLFVRASNAARKDPGYPEKFRRFAVACCRRIDRLLVADELRALDCFDLYSSTRSYDHLKAARKFLKAGYAAPGEWSNRDEDDPRSVLLWFARDHARRAVQECHHGKPAQTSRVYWIAGKVAAALRALDTGELPEPPITNTPRPTPDELAIQSSILRDIFGNPFRPVTFVASWRTEAAVSIARHTYDARDFTTMPILADALEDAGCDSVAILEHCRGPGPHVRGCWVVDQLLREE